MYVCVYTCVCHPTLCVCVCVYMSPTFFLSCSRSLYQPQYPEQDEILDSSSPLARVPKSLSYVLSRSPRRPRSVPQSLLTSDWTKGFKTDDHGEYSIICVCVYVHKLWLLSLSCRVCLSVCLALSFSLVCLCLSDCCSLSPSPLFIHHIVSCTGQILRHTVLGDSREYVQLRKKRTQKVPPLDAVCICVCVRVRVCMRINEHYIMPGCS